MADTTPKKKEPTASEAMFFFAIVKHTKNKADIDWDAVATEQGFKNANVAKVRFGQVKRKLGITTDSPASGSRTTPSKAKPATPTKVAKTPAGRAGTKGKAVGSRGKLKKEDVEEDDETVVGNAVKMEHISPDERVGLENVMFPDDDPF